MTISAVMVLRLLLLEISSVVITLNAVLLIYLLPFIIQNINSQSFGILADMAITAAGLVG